MEAVIRQFLILNFKLIIQLAYTLELLFLNACKLVTFNKLIVKMY